MIDPGANQQVAEQQRRCARSQKRWRELRYAGRAAKEARHGHGFVPPTCNAQCPIWIGWGFFQRQNRSVGFDMAKEFVRPHEKEEGQAARGGVSCRLQWPRMKPASPMQPVDAYYRCYRYLGADGNSDDNTAINMRCCTIASRCARAGRACCPNMPCARGQRML